MGVVTLTDAWPRPGEPFTVGDLDRMPDDGHRYELLDGTLIVSPAPGPPDQRAAVMLCHILELAVQRTSLSSRTWASVSAHAAPWNRMRWWHAPPT